MFTLAISCLIKSNLTWFMDLTFQVSMQYCSLQPWTLLSSPDPSTMERHFHFSPDASLFLELLVIALHSSPVNYLNTFWPEVGGWGGVTHLCFISFCLSILSMGFSRQGYWIGLPFSPPVDCILSELFTMTRASWVVLHGLAHSFIELCKPLHHNKAVIYEGEYSS